MADEPRFAGRSVVITGAGGGIGRACAERFSSEGAAILCADIDGAAAEVTASAIREGGGAAIGRALDVTDPEACCATIADAVAAHGGIDVLVNVAGVGGLTPTPDVSPDEWNHVIGVNLTGTFLMCQAAIRHLEASKGSIVNMASVAGVRAVPYNAAYCASKGGVIMLTKVLAIEFGTAGVRANCLCPSAVDTDFLSTFTMPDDANLDLFVRGSGVIKEILTPEKIAASVAYLASDDASMVTGTTLMMEGGATA
ncbi:MAG: SDR family NAD(P)-dependent oxidoreductase [Acidimicrobiales bacterium]